MTNSPATTPQNIAAARSSLGRVVVGVDGSDESIAALGWALTEARLRGVSVHAVTGCAYHPHWGYPASGAISPPPYSPGMQLGGPGPLMAFPPPVDNPDSAATEVIAAAGQVLDAAISRAVHNDPDSDARPVSLSREVVPGHAAQVLLATVSEADLLVVGARGHGAFVGALLGSVSHHVVSQARCPVVVVRVS